MMKAQYAAFHQLLMCPTCLSRHASAEPAGAACGTGRRWCVVVVAVAAIAERLKHHAAKEPKLKHKSDCLKEILNARILSSPRKSKQVRSNRFEEELSRLRIPSNEGCGTHKRFNCASNVSSTVKTIR